ncbi:MAG: hypothetical protein AAGF47_07060 [Planctomycetota bacterium]
MRGIEAIKPGDGEGVRVIITDQARTLFARVVNELWPKHPELVVPGWRFLLSTLTADDVILRGWHYYIGDMRVATLDEADCCHILAAAALCAERLARCHHKAAVWETYTDRYSMKSAVTNVAVDTGHNNWPSAQFAAVLAEENTDAF